MLETPQVLGSPENAPEIENKNALEIENKNAPEIENAPEPEAEPEVYMQTHNSCKCRARPMIIFCYDFSCRPRWRGDQGQRPDHESLFKYFLQVFKILFHLSDNII